MLGDETDDPKKQLNKKTYQRVGEMGEGVQKAQNSSNKTSKSRDIMYNMVTIVNNTVVYI